MAARRYRFGGFEADAATGELRRQGVRVRIHAQPFQVLMMLVERPGRGGDAGGDQQGAVAGWDVCGL